MVGVEPVAAEVHPHPGHRPAARGPSDDAGALDQRDPVPGPRGPLGGAHPGGPRAQDDQVGVGRAQAAE